MFELDRLARSARAHVQVEWTAEQTARVGGKLARAHKRRARVRRGATAVLAAAAVLLGWSLHRRGAATPVALHFSDGSVAMPMTTSALVQERVAGPDRVVVALLAGGARFDVVHRPERVFRVEAGTVRVEVLGTQFAVERREDGVRVAVEHGHVRVFQGTERTADLRDGEGIVVPPEAPGDAPTEAPGGAEAVAPSDGVAGRTDVPTKAAPTGAPKPKIASPKVASIGVHGSTSHAPTRHRAERMEASVPELAKRPILAPSEPAPAEVAEAPAEPERREREERAEERPPEAVEGLLAQADRARAAHHPSEAVTILQRIVRDHGADAQAPLASFVLGRVLLEELGRPRDAAEAFADVRTLGASEPLAENALIRQVEAWSQAGDPVRARACARAYVEAYPMGHRMGFIRRFLE